MELFKAFVTILARDEASSEVENISNNIMGKLAGAAKTAAAALGALWAGNQVVQFGKDAFYAYSQFEQLEGGVAKLYGNAGQSVEEYAASVGQSVEEAQAAFERNERAQEMVMANAQQAWKTAGMDANAYMQTATSFSASLINSLGGDTEEAARLTNEAMVAMSDNVNTFGSDMSSVQNAFQGFAKQNYTMLDNLKLGYGGTKTEMERLVKDAAAMTKEQEDLNMTVDAGSMSFDNIVKAIQVVQKHQGIYGTTTREALHTIEGSMNATKSAWQNLVAELGKPDADLNARFSDLATAIFGEFDEELGKKSGGLFENVKNEVVTVASNMGKALVTGLRAAFDAAIDSIPDLALNIVKSITDTLSNIGDSLKSLNDGGFDSFMSGFFDSMFSSDGIATRIGTMFSDIGEIIREWAPDISEAFSTAFGELSTFVGEQLGNVGSAILEHGPEIVGNVAETFYGIVEDLTARGPELVTTVAEIIGTVVTGISTFLSEHGPEILSAAGEMISNIGTAIVNHGPAILGNIAETVGSIVGYIANAATTMLTAAITFMGGLITGTSTEGEKLRTWFSNLPQKLVSALGNLSSLLVDAGTQIIQGFWNGLTAKWGEVQDWVSGIGSWIAAHKGPKQYDLGLLTPNGEWIMQSLRTGLVNGLPSVLDTLSDITDSIQTGINANVSFVKASPQSDPALMAILGAIRDNMSMSVYLDGKTLVGGIAPTMNTALGRL